MRKIITIILFCLGFSALITIDQWQIHHWKSLRTQELKATVTQCRIRLENTIKSRFNALESLSSLFILHPETNASKFSHFAELLLKVNPPVRAIQYADTETRVIYVYPPRGNEITIAKPMVLISDPKRGPFVQKALKERRAVIQGPFELRQGGNGVVLRSPIFDKDKFRGFSIGVYDISVLVSEAFNGINTALFDLSLKDVSGNVFWHTGALPEAQLEYFFTVADTRWSIIGQHKEDIPLPYHYRALVWFFGSGFLLAVLYTIFLSWQHEKKLTTTVKERTSSLLDSNKKLLESEERYGLAMTFANDGLYDWDLKNSTIYYSPGWKRLLGYKDNEVKNEFSEWERLTHPEDAKKSWQMLNDVLEGRLDRFELEFKMRHKKGHWVDILSRANIIFDDNGTGTRVVGTHVDISKHKQSEEALEKEKELLMVTLRSIGDGVITTDTNGRIVLMNKVAEFLTGYSQHDAIGKEIGDVFNIIHSLTRQKCSNPVEKVFKERKIVDLANHTNLIARDGTERMIADSGAPIFNSEQEIIGVVLVFRDVTEKYKAEEQLQQSQKMESIGTLAGGIAHDFNNMLGVILGNVSYALTRLKKEDELTEVLIDVQESSIQARSLTKQLLTFAKGGAPVKALTDMNLLLKETAGLVTRGTPTRCTFDLASDLWNIDADKGQINQTISNLVINAGQAMPEGGVIQIQSENITITPSESMIPLPPGNYVKLSVQDQGTGIPHKHLSRIFDPYFTTKQKGSGLGLSTSYSIIKKHNGHISVYSEIDKGTVFHIYLPGSLKNGSLKNNVENHIHRGKGRILVMDDQEALLKMIGRMLNRMGYEVTFSSDGNQAAEAYRKAIESEKPFDLTILDLTIPGGMGGVKTIKEILKTDPKAKVVASSGYSNDPVMANFKEYGFSGIVPKPYTKEQMAELLNTLFEQTEDD